ncbi:MAG: hypothetical protein IJN21_07100 [Clostridia bacterium]|nr:hypothetical protein [Clostridia bacterium]
MGKYDDIINMKYPTAKTRKAMTLSERAAQFSPFAALSGYEEAIDETARLTDAKILLSEDEQNHIGETLKMLDEQISDHPIIRLAYFVPDPLKEGGRYMHAEGEVRKVKAFEKKLILKSGEEIAFEDILFIEAVG